MGSGGLGMGEGKGVGEGGVRVTIRVAVRTEGSRGTTTTLPAVAVLERAKHKPLRREARHRDIDDRSGSCARHDRRAEVG